jgi:hypothetical protein
MPRLFAHGQGSRFGFFSGIHGDEWSVIASVQKAILTHQAQLGSFIFIPECSPSAIQLRTRQNGEGLDLNRSFVKNPQSQEVQAIVTQLQPYTFELCVDFHEDGQHSGVYMYDSLNQEGSPKLAAFRAAISEVASLYSGIDDDMDEKLGGEINQGYKVSSPPEKDQTGEYVYEGFFDHWALIQGKTKHWMTLEVPEKMAQAQKDQIVELFFQTMILS